MTRPKTATALSIDRAQRRRTTAVRSAAAVLRVLRKDGGAMTSAMLRDATSLPLDTVRAGLLILADADLVISDTYALPATQKCPPRNATDYTAVADAEWPEWLPRPDAPAPPAMHGPIVACAIASGAASVWAWAANDARRRAA